MKTTKGLFIGIILFLGAALILNLRLSRSSTSRVFTPRPPAVDSAEWLKRLDSHKPLAEAYAELPKESEWGPIIEQLKQLGISQRARTERIFGEVLSGDKKSAEESIRSLLLQNKAKAYNYREESLRFLYSLSTDPAAAQKWVDENLPRRRAPSTYGSIEKSAAQKSLANDQIDEAISLLQEEISKETDLASTFQKLGLLAKISRLTGRDQIHKWAIDQIKSAILRQGSERSISINFIRNAVDELALLKDWTTLQKFRKGTRLGRFDYGHHSLFLISTYHLKGADAFLNELQKSPKIGISNQSDYISLLNESNTNVSKKFPEIVIRAYMAKGKKAEAFDTLGTLLALEMGNDALYRLALEYFPEQSQAMFEALRPYDPYEERPLIWLAEIALKNNELEKARELVDQAIELDPSDGEQGKDTRMQVYDVLSRILRAQGDTEKADFFREVMVAIRRGEEADDYLEVGLTNEAIRRYQEALGHFQDAYCLQSRLAKTLLDQGRVEEAMVHFEKAFELMPVSFGPVESHCFGCEGIFKNKRVRDLAIATFNKLIESTPMNPRTYYLLGLALEEMNRPEEAATAMKKALELDPKYYNCAKHLFKLALKAPVAVGDIDSLNRQLVGMAPYPDLQEIYRARTDLRQTWLDAQNPPPSPLKLAPLPLPFKSDHSGGKANHVYGSPRRVAALDGWTTEELLTWNSFLGWLDYF